VNQCSVVSAVDGGVCFVLTAEAVGWACGVSIGCDIGDTSTKLDGYVLNGATK